MTLLPPALAPSAARPRRVVALVDCTAFYCSCERVFDPELRHRPVAVLSNNDGCVIARDAGVKRLGVAMGEPYFKCRERLAKGGAVVRSSNYELYGDMSRRVMDTLRSFSDEVEAYSIDEAFVGLPRWRPDVLADAARTIAARVQTWTGVPVHVGIGETKTLAKIADELSKHHGGTFSLVGHERRDEVLESVPVRDVWGIGTAYARKLEAHGVATARHLRDVPLPWARRHLTVVGERLVQELRGVPCLPLELITPSRRGICRSRSFGAPIDDLATLQRAVATFTSRAAEKARRFGLVPRALQVFVSTKYHGPGPHYTGAQTVTLPALTNYTPELVAAAAEVTARVFRLGVRYRNAGVLLLDLRPETPAQANLFVPHDPAPRRLMAAVDALNDRYGAGTVHVAAAAGRLSGAEAWHGRRDGTSPAYTTRWADLLCVD